MAGLKLSTASVPVLKQDDEYRITATQKVGLTDSQGNVVRNLDGNFTAKQLFKVSGVSRYVLDPSSVHSVYPPENHADTWNTIPHILFKEASQPWKHVLAPGNEGQPYLGLFVFQENELKTDSAFLSNLETLVSKSAFAQSHELGTHRTVPLTESQFESYTGYTSSLANGSPRVETLFLQPELYQSLFKDPGVCEHLAHVRAVDTSASSGQPNGQTRFSTCISARTGPPVNASPIKVFAHLCALPFPFLAKQGGQRCAVASLYRWSYVCLPHEYRTLANQFQDLGRTLQPLRASIKESSDTDTYWGRARLAYGYTIARHIPKSGERLLCIYRGMLSPFLNHGPDLPPSDSSRDLMIVDGTTGVADVTYQIAWETGRLLMLSNRDVSSALLRLRGTAHEMCATLTKSMQEGTSSLPKAAGQLPHLVGKIQTTGSDLSDASLLNRWEKAKPATKPTRRYFSLANSTMKEDYQRRMPHVMSRLALATDGDAPVRVSAANVLAANVEAAAAPPTTQYDGTNKPVSTDFATVAKWLVEKWALNSMPWQNLIIDPTHLPPESMRSFFIDPVWMRAFADGALSVGEHYTPEDDVRECIKHCLDMALKEKTATNLASTIPCWGIFVRSTIIDKFPNLQVVAPRVKGHQAANDVLCAKVVDRGSTLLLLFDRHPGTQNFPDGITLSVPDHQMRYSLGDSASWTFDESSGEATSVTMDFNPVSKSLLPTSTVGLPPQKYSKGASNTVFDFSTLLLRPSTLYEECCKMIPSARNFGPSAVLGAHLIRQNPELHFSDMDQDPDAPPLERRLKSTVGRKVSAVPLDTLAQSLPSESTLPKGPATATHDSSTLAAVEVDPVRTKFLKTWNQGYCTDEDFVRRYLSVASRQADYKGWLGLHGMMGEGTVSIQAFNQETLINWPDAMPAPVDFGRVALACRYGTCSYPCDLRFNLWSVGMPMIQMGNNLPLSWRLELSMSGDSPVLLPGDVSSGLPKCRVLGFGKLLWRTSVFREGDTLVVVLEKTVQQPPGADFWNPMEPIEFRLEGVTLAWQDPQNGTGMYEPPITLKQFYPKFDDSGPDEYTLKAQVFAVDLAQQAPFPLLGRSSS